MQAEQERAAQRSAPPSLVALALSLALVGTSIALTELLPPSGSDPLALRWLRLFAGHPGRSGLAVGLIAWALASRARPPTA